MKNLMEMINHHKIEAGETAVNYNVELVGAADEITGKIVNGDVDIAAVPCNPFACGHDGFSGQIRYRLYRFPIACLQHIEHAKGVHWDGRCLQMECLTRQESRGVILYF